MTHLNVEIKARTTRAAAIREILEQQNARFVGVDHQIDTYFRVPKGRLKLRRGNIENTLIHYRRGDEAGPKQSQVTLYHPQDAPGLQAALENALDTLVVVDKRRAIYFIDNVKFHVDEVQGLGSFVEIEAIDQDGTIGQDRLRRQCGHYLQLLGIRPEDLLVGSYSDMLM